MASLTIVHRVSVGLTSWDNHSSDAPCPPWAAVIGGSTCVGSGSFLKMHCAATKPCEYASSQESTCAGSTAAFSLMENLCPISAVSLLAGGADQKLQEVTQSADEAGEGSPACARWQGTAAAWSGAEGTPWPGKRQWPQQRQLR